MRARALAVAGAAVLLTATPAVAAGAVRIAVGPSPTAVLSAGTMAYVTSAPLDAASGSVAFVDLGSDHTVAHVTVGHNPESIALDPDGRHAYVANYTQSGSVSVVDLIARTVVRTLPAGINPGNVAVAGPPGRRLLLVLNQGQTEPTAGSVDVWNLQSMHRIRRLSVGFTPIGVAPLADGLRALVGDGNNGMAYVLDLTRLRFVRQVQIPAGPVNDLRAGTRLVYVAAAGGMSVLRQPTLAPVGDAVDPISPYDPISVAVSAGGIGYVVENGFGTPVPGTVQVLSGPRTTGSLPVGQNPVGIALARGDRSLLVTSYDKGTLWVLPTPPR